MKTCISSYMSTIYCRISCMLFPFGFYIDCSFPSPLYFFRVDGKFLYARLPGNLKENPELQRLDILRKALNAENTFEFFKNLEFEWSSIIAPLLKELSGITRRSNFLRNKVILNFCITNI